MGPEHPIHLYRSFSISPIEPLWNRSDVYQGVQSQMWGPLHGIIWANGDAPENMYRFIDTFEGVDEYQAFARVQDSEPSFRTLPPGTVVTFDVVQDTNEKFKDTVKFKIHSCQATEVKREIVTVSTQDVYFIQPNK